MTDGQIQKVVQMLIAFELLAESMQGFKDLKYFKEVKANWFEFNQVQQTSERLLEKMMHDLPDQAKLESAQMAGVAMSFAKTLTDSYCQSRAKEFTTEAAALIARYDKKSLKKNPDLFRAMYADAGATSYHCFEKGIISALVLINKQE